jgi:hypothetical protein
MLLLVTARVSLARRQSPQQHIAETHHSHHHRKYDLARIASAQKLARTRAID